MLGKDLKAVNNKVFIKEIFSSIQGEGPCVGEIQTFLRFCKCNLNCKYCDTKYKKDRDTKEYSAKELAQKLLHESVSTISLTGGEPLLDVEFLKEFLPLIKPQKSVYLETNGTLTNELTSIIEFVDIVSADIKLESASKQKNQFEINDEFISVAKNKECFVKVVFDEKITKEEISHVLKIVQKQGVMLVLQPMMKRNKLAINSDKFFEIFKIFYSVYPNCRLIPQVHKFLKIM